MNFHSSVADPQLDCSKARICTIVVAFFLSSFSNLGVAEEGQRREAASGDSPSAVHSQRKAEQMNLIQGTRAWDASRVTDRTQKRFELTDLAWFKGAWYCAFREGEIHHNHPSGRGRIIRSADGKAWETAALFDWDAADVREPKLSVTAEKHLMVNTSLAFIQRARRRPKDGDAEEGVSRQSVTWLSPDGEHWSSAYACPTGVNTWRWEVTWHNGMGYSVAYGGKDSKGTLHRTRDGKTWRPLLENFLPGGRGNEASLAFGEDGTAYCLVRDARLRSTPKDTLDSDGHEIKKEQARQTHGTSLPMLGIGKAPYYQEWEWNDLRVDWKCDGETRSAEDTFRAPFGGPKIIRISDGRFAAAARVLGPGQDDGRITLFLVDPENSVLTKFAECAGTTYGSIVEHEGAIWVSFAAPDVSAVFVGHVPLPR